MTARIAVSKMWSKAILRLICRKRGSDATGKRRRDAASERWNRCSEKSTKILDYRMFQETRIDAWLC